MANRETYPSSLFPLRGDLSAEAGAVSATVIGIQTIPVDKPVSPTDDGKVATYVDADGRIEWVAGSGGSGSAVKINGVGVSSDFLFLVNTAFTINYSTDDFLGVRINGV
jgi:hypothetical protein